MYTLLHKCVGDCEKNEGFLLGIIVSYFYV